MSGNWNDPTKWSKGAVPTSSDNVCITVASGTAAYTVTLDGSQAQEFANTLAVGPATGSATLMMEGQGGQDDAFLGVSGAITNTATGTIEETNALGTGSTAAPQDVDLNWGGTFANAGKLITLSGVAGGTRELGGAITNTGTVTIDTNTNDDSGSTTFSNTGAVTAGLGATFVFDGGSQIWTQGAGGTITSSGGGTVDMTNSATFNQGAGAAGQVVLEGSSTLHISGAGAGTFTFHDSDSLVGNVAAGQSLVLQGVGCDHDSFLNLAAAGFTNAGSIDLTNTEGSCTQSQSDVLSWSGTLTNSGSITSDFGVSGGDRELQGNLTNTGTVTINSDTSYDGSSTLFDNKKNVTVANGATLSTTSGQTFDDDTGGSIATTSGALSFNNATLDVGAGSVGTSPILLNDSSTLNLKGAGAGTFDFQDDDTMSGNIGAAQSVVLQTVGCDHVSSVTAPTGFTNAGSIDLTNVRGSCSGSQPATLGWSGTLTNTGTITSDVGSAGGTRELDGNLTNSGTVAINSDTFYGGSAAFFDNKKNLNVAGGANLTTVGGQTLKNDTGGVINTTAPGGLSLNNTTFNVTAGSAGSAPVVLFDSSTLGIGGAGAGTFVFEGGGDTLNVTAGKTVPGQAIVLQGQGCSNGASQVTAPAGFTNEGTIDLTSVKGGCSNSSSAELDWSGTITNTGTISSDFGFAGGARNLDGNLTNSSSGALNINANTNFQNGSGTVLTNNGTLLLASGRKLNLPDGETFKQGATGTLDEQIAGATSFGKLLDPSGPITLGGTLHVDTLNSYAPPGATKFPFIAFNTRSGTFTTTTFSGHSYQVKYDPSDVALIAQDATTTTVTTSASSVPEGAPVTVTATVKGPAAPSPTGTVSFTASGSGTFNPSTANCTLASSGTGVSKCSVTYTPSALGNQTFTANYPGDSAHLSSGGSSSSVSVTTRSTTTAISCSPASVAVGASSSCKATVTDSSAGTKSTPGGSVAFSSDSSGSFSATSCTLTAGTTGTASCSVSYTPSSLGSGTHHITGTFAPDTTIDTAHSGSTGSVGLTVTARSTSTSVKCTPNPVATGSATSCTATVTDTNSGTKTAPTGSVTFGASGSGSFGTSSCTLGNATATAASCSVNYTPLATGGQTITAVYSGDATHKSSSNTFSLSAT